MSEYFASLLRRANILRNPMPPMSSTPFEPIDDRIRRIVREELSRQQRRGL